MGPKVRSARYTCNILCRVYVTKTICQIAVPQIVSPRPLPLSSRLDLAALSHELTRDILRKGSGVSLAISRKVISHLAQHSFFPISRSAFRSTQTRRIFPGLLDDHIRVSLTLHTYYRRRCPNETFPKWSCRNPTKSRVFAFAPSSLAASSSDCRNCVRRGKPRRVLRGFQGVAGVKTCAELTF